MTAPTYFTLTGSWVPDTNKGYISGTVSIQMLVGSGDVLPTSLGGVIVPHLIPAKIVNGSLCDQTGRPGVSLVANTVDLNLSTALYYTVVFSLTYHPVSGLAQSIKVNPVTFTAPTSATTIDLGSVTPAAGVEAGQVVSVGSANITDATTVGRALIVATDASTARTVIGAAGVPAAGMVKSTGTALTPAVSGTDYGTYSKPGSGIPSTDMASAVQTSLGLANTALQPSAVVNNTDGTVSVNNVNTLEPLSTVTIATTSATPVIGQTTYYNATSGNLTPSLPALSGLRVGSRLAVRRDPADTSQNTVTLNCAGSDTFYSSGATSTTFSLIGEQREFQVISVSGTKYWSPAGPINPVQSLDQRYLPSQPKLLVVADNGWGTEALTAPTSTVGTSAYTFTVGIDTVGIVLKYVHAYMSGDFDIDPAGPISFNVSLSVLSSSNPNVTLNTLFPVTFGGRKVATLDPGGEIESDSLFLRLKQGDLISVRSFLASGTAYPYKPTSSRVSNGGGFTATTDLTAPGSAAVASTSGYYLSPASILGYPDPASKVVALGHIGDSIAFSGGDSGAAFSQPLLGLGAYGIRALTGRGGFINLAYSGDTMANFLTTKAALRRGRSLRRVNAVLCEYGVNDLAGGAYTAAQLQANILTAANTIRAMGIKKFFVQTLTPRTTSTDGWATVGNQTAITYDPARITHNAWVRAGCPIDPSTLAPVLPATSGALLAGSFGHPITGWIEMADLVESSRDSGLWKPCQRVVHANITSGSNVLTFTDYTLNSTNLEVGGDNGACVTAQGYTTPGVWPSATGMAVLTSTTGSIPFLAGQTVSATPVNMNPYTADGTHPTSYGYIAMANALIARLPDFAN